MDKSKMAKANKTINYNLNKGGHHHEGMSRPVKQACGEWCSCDDCCKDGSKSLDDTLNPPKKDIYGQVCR